MPDPCDDPARPAALDTYGILDTPREPGFDRLVELAARLCGIPIAVINLVGARRQWFKAETGLGIRETPLDVSICRHFLLRPGLTVVPDMRDDPRLRDNPFVAGEAGLRFYAGCLLRTAGGQGLGTLCVLDPRPRDLDEDQRFALCALAGQVMAQMDLRLALRQKERLLERQALLTREVHHRVKNSLQLVSSIIGLQLRGLEDPAARAALGDAAGRIRRIAAAHEHLHQDEEVTETVDLAAFLRRLIEDLRATAPAGVALALEAPPPPGVAVPLGTAVALSLIANELATNALKHAYAPGEGGEVLVALRPEGPGRRHLLSVRDRGRGLPADLDPRRSRSLGTRIVLALAQQIGAEVAVADAAPGTEARIAFDPEAPAPAPAPAAART